MITNPHSVKQIKLQELGQGDIHSFCLYFLYEWLYQYVQTHIITYFLYDNNNFLKSLNSKCEQIYCNQGQHAGKPPGETLISGLKRKGIILRALMWAVTSLWPQKVAFRSQNYSARAKLMLISDQARDLFWRPTSMNPFQNGSSTSGILNKSTASVNMRWFMCKKRE